MASSLSSTGSEGFKLPKEADNDNLAKTRHQKFCLCAKKPRKNAA